MSRTEVGTVRHVDEVPGILVLEVAMGKRMTVSLEASQGDVGQIRGWPHLIVGSRDEQDRPARLLHGNGRPLHGSRVTEAAPVKGRVRDGLPRSGTGSGSLAELF